VPVVDRGDERGVVAVVLVGVGERELGLAASGQDDLVTDGTFQVPFRNESSGQYRRSST
jgi:hypothetical protein